MTIFHKALEYLGKNNQDIFILNIGAMDGVMFDPLIQYIKKYHWNGLYVEPIECYFNTLKSNIKNGIFENSAISDYDGSIDMTIIDKDIIDQKLVSSFFYGMSAINPPKNGLARNHEIVKKYGKTTKVQCITYQTLLQKHNLTNKNIDIIKIDTEGHDYTVFKQINIELNNTKAIMLEWINLNNDEKTNTLTEFQKYNFRTEFHDGNIVAISPSLQHIL